jgi:hypothetical protein
MPGLVACIRVETTIPFFQIAKKRPTRHRERSEAIQSRCGDEESGLLRRSAPRNDGQNGCNGFISLIQFSNSHDTTSL